jgi:tetratricopeptide (TPR) repeat protein
MSFTDVSPSSPMYDAIALERLANFAVDKLNWNEAARLLQESLAIRKKADGDNAPGYALTLDRLAEVYINQGKIAEAMECLSQALPILEAAYYPAHGTVAAILEHQGDCLVGEGKFALAEPIFKRASDIYTASVTLENRMALRCMYKLAKVYLALGKPADAKAVLLKTLKYVDTPLGPVAEFRYQLALAAIQLKETVEARELLHSAAADFKQRSNYARVADCSSALAEICRSDSAGAEADEWIRQAVRYGQMAIKSPYPDDIFLATLLRA